MGEGTGLGLSMVYGIMKQSGGYVFVDSVLGQNTCFTLLFPAHQGPVDDSYTLAAPVKKETLPARAEGVVLLVEDEAPVRAFAVRALQFGLCSCAAIPCWRLMVASVRWKYCKTLTCW